MNDIPYSQKWQDEQALFRFQTISPLLDTELDAKKKNTLRQQIAQDKDISVRTLYRWEKLHAVGGFSALKPANRAQRRSAKLPKNFSEVLQQAILLKREVPLRSVEQIIYILEAEGWVKPGELKRSTLQRYLYNAGYGKKQMKKYSEAKYSSSRRFCKPHRMMLVQGDIKYGPILPIGPGGKKVQTYLSALIDDHSRRILSSDWYDNQEAQIVEDTFHKAILQFGKPDAFYLDNGTQYISRELKDALGRLSIRILHCQPYAAQSKGKIEAYNSFVDAFLREARAKKIITLEELNRMWHLWVDEYYHNKPHGGLAEYYRSQGWEVPQGGISPLQECPYAGQCQYKVSGTRYEYEVIVKTELIAHQVLSCTSCKMIGGRVEGKFPTHINGAKQYGAGVSALTAALLTVGYMSVDRVQKLLNSLGIRISQGAIQGMLGKAASRVEATVEQIKQKIGGLEVAHFDETGVRVNGKLHWLHCACNDEYRFYSVQEKRGGEAMEAIGILPKFRGIAVTDFWQPYQKYDNVLHAMCCQHL